MSFNADLQVLTQPGATGNQTYSLASNFDPKAIILWATPAAADGSVAHRSIGIGLGTYRGSVVQQRYAAVRGLDAQAAADDGVGAGSNAALVLLTNTAGSGTRDLEIGLVSMQTGATSNVVLNWVNLHTTASIRVFMLVLGGSEITDALVDDFTCPTVAATQDETVVAGFGQPDLLFFIKTASSYVDSAATDRLAFGFAKKGEAGRHVGFAQTDGNTASLTAMTQRSDRAFSEFGGPAATSVTTNHMAQLDTTVANWPTDGFRVLYDANPLFASVISYLALKTTAQIATGSNTAPTAGTPPVVQDNSAGFVPKVGLVFGWNLAASSAVQTSAADQCGVGIGAYDGTDAAWAGFTEDDAAGTMVSKSQQSTAKIIRNYSVTPTLTSEADGAFSTTNLRLSWTTVDTVAREYQWLAIGDAAVLLPIPDVMMAPLEPVAGW